MGIIVECDQCGYSDSFTQGKGMEGWGGIENLEKFLNKKQFKKITEILGNLSVSGCDISMATYLCHHCSTLNERLDYHIWLQPNGDYRPGHRCSKCSKLLIEKIDLEALVDGDSALGGLNRFCACPQCRHSLRAVGLFDWD